MTFKAQPLDAASCTALAMVKAMKQRRGRRYNEWRRRLGERFDPEAFDKAGVNAMLAEWRERNAPASEATEEQPQPLPTVRCEMCGKPADVKPGAGKPKLYCSPACKQAAYRKSKGAQVESRQDDRSLGNVQVHRNGIPICALAGCEEPAEAGKRGRWRMYCSDAHKQRAKRIRKAEATRAQFGPSDKRTRPLPSERQIKHPEDDLYYWRKGRGVVHMGVSPNAAFCGRATESMAKQDGADNGKLCQRCQKTHDNKTWWHGWRDAFGDELYED